MQFLWQYVEDMVGKGVEMPILGKMFFYAALNTVPMALPLSVLLASLMTFGNLGEHMELLAMKASGISLLRIMKPLIVFAICIVGISFVFQNNIGPVAQTRLYTIIYSLKQTSPELEIPEKSFYKDIPGYNIYVREKTKNSLLKNIMIYNHSNGFDRAEIIVADSGRLKVADSGEFLILTLHSGEVFGNADNSQIGLNKASIPYRRETFSLRDIKIDYDTNFKMEDESIYQNREISKNLNQLRAFSDSVTIEVDSLARASAQTFREQIYYNSFIQRHSYSHRITTSDTTYVHDFQLFYENAPRSKQINYLEEGKSKISAMKNDYEMRKRVQEEQRRSVRLHDIQYHKKFSLSLACLLFFFIGAPLGAIIRKGGLGMPAVLSVIIFLLYYTVDTLGMKLARQGAIPVWEGMWLSTLLLLILGSFFTYKAVNDSVIMNPDAWKIWLQRLTGKREVRVLSKKELIMVNPDYLKDIASMQEWNVSAKEYLEKNKRRPFYLSFWRKDFRDEELNKLIAQMESWIEDLRNSDQNLIIGKLMDYPIITPLHFKKINAKWEKWTLAIFFPVGLILYFVGLSKLKQIRQDLQTTLKVNAEIEKEINSLLDKENDK